MPDEQPLDAFDPRFVGSRRPEAEDLADDAVRDRRSLVDSRGPGASPEDPKVRILRVAVPLLALLGFLAIGAVFYSGLRPTTTSRTLGPTSAIAAQVAARPLRVCLNDNNPCAWITDVGEGRLRAFNTNGPLAEEYGRLGVSWCASSGWFGSNSTGSRWDQRGRLADGPSIRSLDEFTLREQPAGTLVIDFGSLTAGRAAAQVEEVMPRAGPDCEEIPFDRDIDLTVLADDEE